MTIRKLTFALLAIMVLAACGAPAPNEQASGQQADSTVTVFRSPT